jgi:hypothetical protein
MRFKCLSLIRCTLTAAFLGAALYLYARPMSTDPVWQTADRRISCYFLSQDVFIVLNSRTVDRTLRDLEERCTSAPADRKAAYVSAKERYLATARRRDNELGALLVKVQADDMRSKASPFSTATWWWFTMAGAPRWLLSGLLCAAALLMWTPLAVRRFRRFCYRRSNRCPHCAYDLTGNVSGTCPECGAGVTTHASVRH